MAFVLALAAFAGISLYVAAQQAGLMKHVGTQSASVTRVTPSAASARTGPGSVIVGALRFPYAVDWRPAQPGKIPSSMRGSSEIKVIAGLCSTTAAVNAHGSTCGVGMTYLLFGQGREFPALTDLETTFDAGFARSFPHFAKVSAQRLVSDGSVPYLRYEFTYARKGVAYREIVAAYSTRRQGIITLSSGTDTSILARRSQIDKVSAAALLA